MKDIAEAVQVINEVLGKTAAEAFVANFEELTCFIRSLALNSTVSEEKMRSSLNKYAEGIVAASIKCYLDEHYMDRFGTVEVTTNGRGIYDKNMKPIRALESIHHSQKEVMGLIVNRGMHEFTKGRQLARVIEVRSAGRTMRIMPNVQSREQIEVEIIRLERKLPNLTSEEAQRLKKMYASVRARNEG